MNFLEFWFRSISNHNSMPDFASIFHYLITSSNFEMFTDFVNITCNRNNYIFKHNNFFIF